MKRLSIIIPDLGLGGAEGSLARLANALINDGRWQLDIIVYNSRSSKLAQALDARIHVHILTPLSAANPLLWIDIRKKLKGLKPDLVLGWSTYANLLTIVASLPPHCWRTVISERNYTPRVFDKHNSSFLRKIIVFFCIRHLYRHADVITANSEECLRFLRSYIGTGPRYHHLPNFIDVQLARIRAKRSFDGFPIASSGPRILAVGRLVHQKGFDTLLEAMAEVRNHEKWSLAIVGDGAEKGRLVALTNKLNLGGAVHWYGSQNDPFPYYGWADIVIVPSRFEGFANVPLEAMACGRTVICTDCQASPREITDNGRTAALVPVEDPVALATAILYFGRYVSERKRLGKRAFNHVSKKYDAQVIIPKTLSLMQTF